MSAGRFAAPRQLLERGWNLLLDFAYPPRCGGCDVRGTLFCDECRRAIMRPNYADVPDGLTAFMCVGVFAGPLREAIHKLKYQNDTPLARPLAGFIHGALGDAELWQDASGNYPTIVPVPLHPSRRRARGFNQAELIGRELSGLTSWEMASGLVRAKDTRSQVGLHHHERHENVRGAFAWQGQQAPERVLLVDDVCTTGATLSECANTLLACGACDVYAATVAKAVGSGPDAGK